MAEIRALIVDDEPLARRGIRQLLAPYRDVVIVGECRDGSEAVRALASLQPDLVFLDVQMPGLDGFEAIRVRGVERMPVTVFVTAHDQFAVRAFEAQALDYLVKPLGETRFRQTMSRVLERLRSRVAIKIPVRTAAGQLLLDPGEIDWLAAQGDHTEIHAGSRRYRVRETLTALTARLDPERFFRVHRSAVIRLDQVRELVTQAGNGEALARLRDGTEIPISRRRLAALKARLRPGDRPPRKSRRSPQEI